MSATEPTLPADPEAPIPAAEMDAPSSAPPQPHRRSPVGVGLIVISAAVALGLVVVSVAGLPLTGRMRTLAWSASFGAFLWGIGALLFARAGARFRPRHLLFAIIPILLTGLLLELAFRGYYGLQQAIVRRYDHTMFAGWGSAENQQRVENLKGYGEVRFTTSKYGFRVFGDPQTTRTKLLAIGDSYTEGHCISDGKSYFNYVAQNSPNVELFAYGAGAYATLQEYMILDRYFDEIKPDIILWQFCANDIVGNDHELDSASPFKTYRKRPYLMPDGSTRWMMPRHKGGKRWWLVQHSYLLQFLEVRAQALRPSTKDWLEYKLSFDDPRVIRALDTTSRLMGMLRKRCGDIPIVAFSVDDVANVATPLAEICARHNIKYLPGVSIPIEQARLAGTVVDGRPHDFHWNEVGHEMAGKQLLEFMRRENVLPSPGE